MKLKTAQTLNKDSYLTVDLFLAVWLSDCCDNDYFIDKQTGKETPIVYSIYFEDEQDEIFARLQGIPSELSKYLKTL